MNNMRNIDLYNNYFDDEDLVSSDYPKFVSWENPEDRQQRQRILRNKKESDDFFKWFLGKYPDIKYTVD
jgi:hypothetical protein